MPFVYRLIKSSFLFKLFQSTVGSNYYITFIANRKSSLKLLFDIDWKRESARIRYLWIEKIVSYDGLIKESIDHHHRYGFGVIPSLNRARNEAYRNGMQGKHHLLIKDQVKETFLSYKIDSWFGNCEIVVIECRR